MNYVKYLREMVGQSPVILVGSVVIIHKNSMVLLQKRKENSKWGLIGGLMELGESTEETAIREASEEAGIQLKSLKLCDVHSGKNSFIKVSNGDEFYSVSICYETSDYDGDVCINDDESLEFRYFNINNLPEYIVGSHESMINKYMENSNESKI